MGSSPTTMAPLLLWNIITSLFIFADKSLLNLAQKFKLLHFLRSLLLFLRSLLLSSFLFFLRLLPSLFPSLVPSSPQKHSQPPPYQAETAVCGGGDSGIARALTQLLKIINNIPVSSRKYEIVRSLAERLIDENLQEGAEALLEVNRKVLSVAFSRTLTQVDAAVGDGEGVEDWGLNRVLRAVRYYGGSAWTRLGKLKEEPGPCVRSAEKEAAELLWLAQRMAASGCADEAVSKWGSATHLAWLALSAEPRLQGSLVKISAFLFKHAKDLGSNEGENGKKEQHRETKMKMLMSWLPLLCRASIGTDAPILSVMERAELERALEETIDALEGEEEQEKVLSLWLHYFTHCPSSDWPDLYACYVRWCRASRKLLLQ